MRCRGDSRTVPEPVGHTSGGGGSGGVRALAVSAVGRRVAAHVRQRLARLREFQPGETGLGRCGDRAGLSLSRQPAIRLSLGSARQVGYPGLLIG